MPLLLEGPVKLIVAIVIIIASIILGRVLGTFIQKLLLELEIQRLFKRFNINLPSEEFIGTIIKYLVYIAGIFFALSRLGLASQVVNLILSAILIVIILSIILNIKDSARNMFAGFLIHQKHYFKVGDEITIDNVTGKIEKISLFETKIRTKEGLFIIPNSLMSMKVIKVN